MAAVGFSSIRLNPSQPHFQLSSVFASMWWKKKGHFPAKSLTQLAYAGFPPCSMVAQWSAHCRMPPFAQLAAFAACYLGIVTWVAEDLKVCVEETGEGEETSGGRLGHLSLDVPSFHLEKGRREGCGLVR